MFNLFNRNKNKLVIRFHSDANSMAEHGTFYASHKGLGLDNYPVRFAFEGLSTPPALNRDIFNYIMDKAEGAGFIVHGMRSYHGMVQNTNTKVSTAQVRQHIATTPNKRALEIHYATERAKNTGESQVIQDGKLLVKPDGTCLSAQPGSKFTDIYGGGGVIVKIEEVPAGTPPDNRNILEDAVLDMSGMCGNPNSLLQGFRPGDMPAILARSKGMPYPDSAKNMQGFGRGGQVDNIGCGAKGMPYSEFKSTAPN